MKNYSRYQIATAIAVLFHLIGIVGIVFIDEDLFVRATSLNLLLMLLLLIYTQSKINIAFILFFLLCFLVGFTVEWVGTSTGYLFGNYMYGDVLGPKVSGVPLIIGVNWFIIIYCCGVTMIAIFNRLTKNLDESRQPKPIMKMASVVSDGALLAVFFDWIMEPAAVALGYWSWEGGEIPMFNYICWLFVSAFLLMIFHLCKFEKKNKFAVNLLLIQLMFFLVLRSIL